MIDLNRLRIALSDPNAPWYGSDVVPWVDDLLTAYEALQAERKGLCVLLSDLDQSRFVDEKGIGGPPSCVKLFPNEEAATKFAAEMIRKYDTNGDFREAKTDAELLEWFQESIGGLEYFHIRDVVE